MGGKKKAAKSAARESRRASALANKRYEEWKSGKMPSVAALQAKKNASLAGVQMRSAYKSSRNPFQRALMSRQGMQSARNIQAQSLGSMATARAQEQISGMSMAMGHQFGQISNATGYQSGAHNGDIATAAIGAVGSAASGMI